MKNILVIGSLNMDYVLEVHAAPEAGQTVSAQRLDLIPGGKGANQAYAAGRLGGNVAMLGAVGCDTAGDALLASLRSAGVDTRRILRVADTMTGMASICVDAAGENRIVVAPGANACVTVPYLQENDEALEWCDLLLLQLEIPLESVVYAAARARELGKKVLLDPAPARDDLPESLLRCLYLIKPNEQEARTVAHLPQADAGEAACTLLHAGVENVLITMGGEGSRLYAQDGSTEVIPAQKVHAVDTTAAGDCFMAALAAELARGATLPQAAAFASRAAAISVTRKGAQTSIPSLSELE